MRYRVKRRPKAKIKRRRQPVTLRSKLRQERSLQAWQLIKIIVFTGLFAAAGWWSWKSASSFAFQSGYFEILRINVKGLENIAESEITALLPFRVGDNMLKVWLSVAERNLRKSKPELEDVNINRKWQSIEVEIKERKPLAFVNIKDKRLGLDEDNMPFPLRGSWVDNEKSKLPEVVTKDVSERRRMLRFVELLNSKANDLYSEVLKFQMEPPDDVVLNLRDGARIFWGSSDAKNLKDRLKKLAQVREDAKKRFKKLEYINMRYFKDGRILIKPVKS